MQRIVMLDSSKKNTIIIFPLFEVAAISNKKGHPGFQMENFKTGG